ncbi:MAG: SMC-Scp complex subunit ScpB [Oscillospiraceae bacterium]|nr:SMC-Scp complex subunit ScpB [Oscillospiraceae bacterium]MDD4368625.1 SMC-Scp complex subunit ScpB [Oscillospiraceae bacterium]
MPAETQPNNNQASASRGDDDAETLQVESGAALAPGNPNRLQGQLEALLFASGDPLPVTDLARACDITEAACKALLQQLAGRLEADESRGILLRQVRDRYCLISKPLYKDSISKLFTARTAVRLSQAAYEVLACVAYNQPVTRAQVETVRGVNSDAVISRLEELGYIFASGQLEAPGHPTLFSVTDRFLLECGLNSLDELPPMELLMYSSLQEFEQKLKQAENPGPNAQGFPHLPPEKD